MKSSQEFDTYGALHVKDAMGKELLHFLTHILLRESVANPRHDDQVPDCLTIMGHEIVFDTVLEKLWPVVEVVTGMDLIPTYSYARLYQNGNVLEKHKDREECEISVTIQLGRSHHYSWPIWMDGKRYDLAEGDAIIYKGCELTHWRDACVGPDNYYSGQLFLHFVDANGPFRDKAYDTLNRPSYDGMFIKQRTRSMEDK